MTMVRRCPVALALAGLVLCGLAAAAPSEEPAKPAERQPDASTVARHAWAVMDQVLRQHVEPPPRQQMLLSGARVLFKAAGVPTSTYLSRHVSDLATEEQVTDFVRHLWDRVATAKAPAAAEREAVFLSGLLAGVPGRPRLLTAQDLKVMEQLDGNRYVGIGIQISMHKETGLSQIIFPFPGGPARKAGMKAGDLILEVDGAPATGGIARVVQMLRGEDGTDVTVAVRQPDAEEPRTYTMTRGIVPFQTAVGYRRASEEDWSFRPAGDEPVAYVRLSSLRASTLHELRRLEARLQKEGNRALVLDLRFCVGGHMPSAAMVADGLLDGGVMWRVRDGQDRVKEYKADRDCLFRGWPVVVLVNYALDGLGGELVAAALQDNGRAKLVGEAPRPQEAYVKTLVTLPDGLGTVDMRTAVVERAPRPEARPPERPSGPPVPPPLPLLPPGADEVFGPTLGVRPDCEVKMTAGQYTDLRTWQQANEMPERAAKLGPQPPADPQLDKALDLLRAALKTPKAQ
jgi:carboxyl-terminal processing protease